MPRRFPGDRTTDLLTEVGTAVTDPTGYVTVNYSVAHYSNIVIVVSPEDDSFNSFIQKIDDLFGLKLMKEDISDELKNIITQREKARDDKDFSRADELREELLKSNISIRDTQQGTIWSRV